MKREHGLSIAKRLEKHRIVRGECWETSLDPNKRYPQIKVAGRKAMVHRAAYEVLVGDIPEGMSVLHRCDNPRCHNPEHLFLGTLSDNMRDMWAKGRHAVPSPKTDPQTIAEMHASMTQKQIAAALGISQTAVSYALRQLGVSRGRGTTFRSSQITQENQGLTP